MFQEENWPKNVKKGEGDEIRKRLQEDWKSLPTDEQEVREAPGSYLLFKLLPQEKYTFD